MEVTLLGTGTSQGVPVIGCQCPVCCSSDQRDQRLRTSAVITAGGQTVLIDCGPDFRQQALRESLDDVDAILLTHEHNDHLIGLDDIRPILFRRRSLVPIYCLPRVAAELKRRFYYAFEPNIYPGAPRFVVEEIEAGRPVHLENDVSILPILVMHGGLPILGFRINSFAYLTDVKKIPAGSFNELKDLDVLVLNALHHRPHHSHLNLTEALELADQVKAKKTILTHVSHYMGLHDDIDKQLPMNVDLGYDGLKIVL